MQVVNQKDEERYKLNLKAHIAYKNPHNFKRYYTGGPNKPLREKPFYVSSIIIMKYLKITSHNIFLKFLSNNQTESFGEWRS